MIIYNIFTVFILIYSTSAQQNPTSNISPTNTDHLSIDVSMIMASPSLSLYGSLSALVNDSTKLTLSSVVVKISSISNSVVINPTTSKILNSSAMTSMSPSSAMHGITSSMHHSPIHASSSQNMASSGFVSHISSKVHSSALLSTDSIKPVSMTTSIIYSSTVTPSPTHTTTPKVIIECGKECQALRKRLYAAAIFAVLFLVISIILAILLYRQYRISRDYQNDPMLSRLI